MKDRFVPSNERVNSSGQNNKGNHENSQQGRKLQDNQRGGHGHQDNSKSREKISGHSGDIGNKQSQSIKDSDTCPLPGNLKHAWGECRIN